MKQLHSGFKEPTPSGQYLKIYYKHLWLFIMRLFSSWKRTSKELRCFHSSVQINPDIFNFLDSEFGILILFNLLNITILHHVTFYILSCSPIFLPTLLSPILQLQILRVFIHLSMKWKIPDSYKLRIRRILMVQAQLT